MRHTPCGCTSARLSGFTGSASFAVTPQPASGGSSSQTPHPSPCRKRQVSSVPLLVLSKLQTLRWFAIWFHLSCQKKQAKRFAWRRVILRAAAREFLAAPRGLNALFGRRIATIPMAFGSGKCTTLRKRQSGAISILLISGILGGGPMWASAPTNVCEKQTGQTTMSALTNMLHHRRIRRWPAISTAVCFSIFLRGNCFRCERCLHAGGAVV